VNYKAYVAPSGFDFQLKNGITNSAQLGNKQKKMVA
jgi:hypothetical protein